MLPEVLAPLVVSWMVALSPPDRDALRVTYPEAQESVEERRARYDSIGADVARAVESLPPVRRRGAAELLIAIAWHESGFMKDVDLGPCAPRRLKIGGCDRGRAKTMWQLQAWDGGTREESAKEALRKAYSSMKACQKMPVEDRLAIYAGGRTCESRLARQRSREIWRDLQKIRTLRAVKTSG